MTARAAAALCLGRLVVVTDRRQAEITGRPLDELVGLVARAGAPLVLYREKDLPDDERAALGARVAGALRGTPAQLLVASDAGLAIELGATGVHLASSDPTPMVPGLAFGRSCHDRADVSAAADEGASWCTLSPTFATSSKPGYGPALGTQTLASLHLPTYALGGIDAANARSCRDAGAHGVAVMGALMGAADPEALVRHLLEATA